MAAIPTSWYTCPWPPRFPCRSGPAAVQAGGGSLLSASKRPHSAKRLISADSRIHTPYVVAVHRSAQPSLCQRPSCCAPPMGHDDQHARAQQSGGTPRRAESAENLPDAWKRRIAPRRGHDGSSRSAKVGRQAEMTAGKDPGNGPLPQRAQQGSRSTAGKMPVMSPPVG